MRKHYNKIIAGVLTAAMIVPTAVSVAEPMRSYASQILGETTFDHKMLPWHTAEASPAKQYFDIADGNVHITILVPEGADKEKWDLQFRHRNLNFQKGHEYKVSFKAKSSRDGFELCSCIGTIKGDEEYFELDGSSNDMHMGPHMGGQWPSAAVKLTKEWQTFEGIFKPTKDLDAVEWRFDYAKGTKYQGNAIQGDELWFDDMSIEDLTLDVYGPQTFNYGYTTRKYSGLDDNFISVNQLGYCKGLAKSATLSDNKGDITYDCKKLELDDINYDYEIVRTSDQEIVYTGKTSKPVFDQDSGDNVCRIDFTGFDEEGEYYIRIKGKSWRSFPFRIGSDIYREAGNDMLTNALNYFYLNRAGSKIRSEYITSGEARELAHAHQPDDYNGFVLNEWQRAYYNNPAYYHYNVFDKNTSGLNTGGGWYNGRDFGKSMTEGGMSVWTLQNMYERSLYYDTSNDKFKDGSGKVVIPETGNSVPDILDECRYELDFMSKMKVKPNEPTWGDYAGMYYHSARSVGFDADMRDYECECLYCVEPPTFAATLNYAACAAQGARLWAEYDDEYAKELWKSAKDAYDAYLKYFYKASPDEESNYQSLYAPQYKGVGSYFNPEDEVEADAYWAACELYITAKEMEDTDAQSYFLQLSDYDNAFKFTTRITGGNNEICDGSLTLFNSGNPASAGSMSLLLNKRLMDGKQERILMDSVVEAADDIIDVEKGQGYGIPYMYNGPGSLPNGLAFQVWYTGFEQDSNERALNNMFALAYAYDITGDDKYLNGVVSGMDYLLGNNSMAYSFISGYGSYHVKNPVHIYWKNDIDSTKPKAPSGVIVSGPNSKVSDPYTRSLGFPEDAQDPSERFYVDSSEAWSTNESSLSCNASLAWIVSFLQDEACGETDDTEPSGDINSDGVLNMADYVLLKRWMLGIYNIKLPDWKEADFCKDNRLDVFDLCHMKKLILKNNELTYVEPDVRVEYGSPFFSEQTDLKIYRGPDESYEVIGVLPVNSSMREWGHQDNDNRWMFIEYKGQYGWINTLDDNGHSLVFFSAVAAKPVIYLYPEEKTDVHVELELIGSELSTTYPKYNNGWDVTAYPDGKLVNKTDGTNHKYLFWDSVNCSTRFDMSEGFCVAGSDTEDFLKEKLTYMGLTEEEMNEFIVYWLPKMEHNAYNLIAFQGDAYTDSAKLEITPSPDSLCRIFMVYAPLEKAVDIEPQQLRTFERNGFTVVEWGGCEIE